MNKIIEFNPELRSDIESGKYEVQTRNGRKVNIIDWECKCYNRNDIIAKVLSENGESENIMRYYSDGQLVSDSTPGPRQNDLVLVINEEDDKKEEPKADFLQFRAAIESGELRAVTEFGEPAEIVKWDCQGKYPILAAIYDGDTTDACFYDETGTSATGSRLFVRNKLSVIENYPEGFTQTVCEYLNSMIEDQYFPDELLEILKKIPKISEKATETGAPMIQQELEDTLMSYLYSPATSYSQDKAKEITKTICDISRKVQFDVEVSEQSVPLSETEKLVKDAILRSIKNGKLGHVEVKSITTYLTKLLEQEKPQQKEENSSPSWLVSDRDQYFSEYKKSPVHGALVLSKGLLSQDKITVTDRVKKGDIYFPLTSIKR
jgi:hypothetical protein